MSYTAYWADSADGVYEQVCKYTSNSGKTTNDTYAMQISADGQNGFYLENLKFTVLDA